VDLITHVLGYDEVNADGRLRELPHVDLDGFLLGHHGDVKTAARDAAQTSLAPGDGTRAREAKLPQAKRRRRNSPIAAGRSDRLHRRQDNAMDDQRKCSVPAECIAEGYVVLANKRFSWPRIMRGFGVWSKGYDRGSLGLL
jgi:hypothetical protein